MALGLASALTYTPFVVADVIDDAFAQPPELIRFIPNPYSVIRGIDGKGSCFSIVYDNKTVRTFSENTVTLSDPVSAFVASSVVVYRTQ